MVYTYNSGVTLQLDSLAEWISPTYLDIGVQSQIQQQFEADSEIELPGFLLVRTYVRTLSIWGIVTQVKVYVSGMGGPCPILSLSIVSTHFTVVPLLGFIQDVLLGGGGGGKQLTRVPKTMDYSKAF